MRCRALPCGAALCFLSNTQSVPGIMRSSRYQIPVCTCLLVFLLSTLMRPPSRSSSCFFFRKLNTYCRSECGIANNHTAQHRAISSAQAALGIIKSLVVPNHRSFLPVPFTLSCIFPSASVAGGVSRPRSGVLVHTCIHSRGLDSARCKLGTTIRYNTTQPCGSQNARTGAHEHSLSCFALCIQRVPYVLVGDTSLEEDHEGS